MADRSDGEPDVIDSLQSVLVACAVPADVNVGGPGHMDRIYNGATEVNVGSDVGGPVCMDCGD